MLLKVHDIDTGNKCVVNQCTEVQFASFLSCGFNTMAVINPQERKLAKHTPVTVVN